MNGFKYTALMLCLFSSAPALGQSAEPKSAQTDKVYYLTISRADAATVLNQLAQQSDTILVYPYDLAAKVQANAVYGYFTLDKALAHALTNTGLEFARVQGQIIISPQATPASNLSHQTATHSTTDTMTKMVSGIEIIQVDGLRASLHRAQDIKRNATTIVDAIVSEEIGKLPDITSADSVSHLSGLQVERYNDEVNRVLVRGLPNFTTTYNGREFFTAELHTARLQDFSSHAIAQVEIHKTGAAHFIEPGLTGVVNIKTHRPLDFKGEKMAAGSTI